MRRLPRAKSLTSSSRRIFTPLIPLGYAFSLSFQEDRRGGANNERDESQKLEELGATVRLETG